MAHAVTSTHLHGSRLVRALCELAAPAAVATPQHFTRQLGDLVDLADSIRLSVLLAGLGGLPFRSDVVGPATVKKEFIKQRANLLKSVLKACVPGSSTTRIRFPEVDECTPQAQALAAGPYLACYAAQQSELDYKVRRLQLQVRRDISGISPELARLAKLDETLLECTSAQGRKLFGAIPALLQRRFEQLLADYRESPVGNEYDFTRWSKQLEQLRNEIQGLLLAEAETRLLPAIGLIEALDEQNTL